MKRRTSILLALALSSACAGAPAPPPPTPSLGEPATPPVASAEGSSFPVAADAGADGGAAARGVPSKVPPPGDPAACATVAATGRVGSEELRICLADNEGGTRSASVVTRDVRRLDESLVPFDAALGATRLKGSFRDLTGDRIDDALVEAPAWKDLTCRYVFSGATLLDVLAGKESYRASASLGLSFAARVANGKHAADPWAYAANVTSPISQGEACALVKKAQKGFGAFQQVATDDVEIVDYREPSMPHCLTRKPTRAATPARLAGTQPIDCASMQCSTDASFCRNHEPDPTTDFYLFVKEGGRFKIRAIAYLRSEHPVTAP